MSKPALLLTLLVCLISPLYAQNDIESSPSRKIGLALSGGGARGLTHIGILKALEELNIRIDVIAGTSMGSIVAGLYAIGYSPERIETEVLKIDWERLFAQDKQKQFRSLRNRREGRKFFLNLEIGIDPNDRLTTASSMLGSHDLFLTLKRLTHQFDQRHFDQFRIPFRAVAVDLNQAKPIVLDRGDLALAMRASMAVPFIFSPIPWGNHLLVDGGILNNLPVDVAKDMGADTVIAINITSPLGKINASSSVLELTKQAIDTALIQNTQKAMALADLIITPEINDFAFYDFDRAPALIAIGYQAVMGKKHLFKGLSQPKAEFTKWKETHEFNPVSKHYKVSHIKYKGNQRTSVELLNRFVKSNVKADKVELKDIENITSNLMALNDFQQINYHITEKQCSSYKPYGVCDSELQIDVLEKPWGPHYFRFGFNGFTTQDTDPIFRWLFKHEWLNINRYGASMHNHMMTGSKFMLKSEFIQPIFKSNWSLSPYASLTRQARPRFIGNREVARFTKEEKKIGFDFIYQRSNYSEFKLGYVHRSGDEELEIGTIVKPDLNIDDDAIKIEYNYDSLDDPYFAREGSHFLFKSLAYSEALGSEHNYIKSVMKYKKHYPIMQEGSFISEFQMHLFSGESLPEHEGFLFGGLNDFAGYRYGAIEGSFAYIFRLGFMFPIQSNVLKINDQLNFLVFAHAGDVWGEKLLDKDESFKFNGIKFGAMGALVWDTPFGVVLAGVGHSESGNVRYYLTMGNLFNDLD